MLTASHPPALQPARLYHIYHHGTDYAPLFISAEDYQIFLDKVKRFILPVGEVYAYCLLPDRFHLLVRFHTETQLQNFRERKYGRKGRLDFPTLLALQFEHFFKSYTRIFNYNRRQSGTLFAETFHRTPITDEGEVAKTIVYIHREPQRYAWADDFRAWRFSSYRTILSTQKTVLKRERALDFFEGKDNFLEWHQWAYESCLENG